MRFWMMVALCAPSVAFAGTKQLFQQGRILDGGGAPINGLTTITLRLLDGSDVERHAETFNGVDVQNGYFSINLGAGTLALDTSVFLDHGAIDLEISVNGSVFNETPLGGYPYVVAQQSLLALETTAQATLAAVQATGSYSKDCIDWSARGWSSETDCRQDGRWHLYGQTTGSWLAPWGQQGWVEFHEASVEGADTKMRIGREWYEVSMRSTDVPGVNGSYVFLTQAGSKHVGFYLNSAGQVTDVLATNGSAAFHGGWLTDLGNWHYFNSGYQSHGSGTDESANDGIEVWARY